MKSLLKVFSVDQISYLYYFDLKIIIWMFCKLAIFRKNLNLNIFWKKKLIYYQFSVF